MTKKIKNFQEKDPPLNLPGCIELTVEEHFRLFDARVRKYLNMSGSEFINRWDRGEYKGIDSDSIEGLNSIVMFMPDEARYDEYAHLIQRE